MAGSINSPRSFITLEGPDGAGKSTQQRLLVDRIAALGRGVIATREPGGTDFGEQVRRVLLQSSSEHDALADALLFSAARRQLVETVIAPALERGEVVVCDRYADSTLAYQGYGAGVDLGTLRMLAAVATAGLTPTRTLLLDLPVATGLARRHSGSTSDLTRFETGSTHDVAFHERVRAGFLGLAADEPERWRIIDASHDTETVAIDVWAAVEDLFWERADRP